MSMVDPTKTAVLKGTGLMFWISGVSGVDGALGNTILTRRVAPVDVLPPVTTYHDACLFLWNLGMFIP